MTRSARYYLAICTAFSVCLPGNVRAQNGPAVWENLKRYDSIYEAGLSVSGTLNSQDQLVRRMPRIEVNRRWELAFDNDRCGYLLEIVGYEKPKFHEPNERTGGSLDAHGWLVLPIRTREWGYWGADCSGNLYIDTVIRVSRTNEVVETGTMYNSSLFGPKDVGPNIRKRTLLWSLGRFYGQLIDQITSTQPLGNGRIRVSALGHRGDQSGRWELEIEPAAAWMVREARFYDERAPEIVAGEMKNSGTAWQDSYCIPQSAVFNYQGSVDGHKETTSALTFAPAVAPFDEKLYESAQQAVTKDRPPNLTIHDHRTSPPLIFQPDDTSAMPLPENIALADGKRAVIDRADGKHAGIDQALAQTGKSGVMNTSGPSAGGYGSATGPFGQASTRSAVPSALAAPVVPRPRYLLPTRWAVVVLIVAAALAAGACVFLFKPRRS